MHGNAPTCPRLVALLEDIYSWPKHLSSEDILCYEISQDHAPSHGLALNVRVGVHKRHQYYQGVTPTLHCSPTDSLVNICLERHLDLPRTTRIVSPAKPSCLSKCHRHLTMGKTTPVEVKLWQPHPRSRSTPHKLLPRATNTRAWWLPLDERAVTTVTSRKHDKRRGATTAAVRAAFTTRTSRAGLLGFRSLARHLSIS